MIFLPPSRPSPTGERELTFERPGLDYRDLFPLVGNKKGGNHINLFTPIFRSGLKHRQVLISDFRFIIFRGTIIAIVKFHNLYKNVVILAIQFMTDVDETKLKVNYPLPSDDQCC
jgi:hypothetical protein